MMRLRLIGIIACLLLLTTGCPVNQKKDVQTYRRVLEGADHSKAPPYDPNEALTLKRALALANTQNEQLAIAGEKYLQSLIDKDRAFANFLPTISFVPTYMREEKSSLAEGNPLIEQFLLSRTWDLPAEANMKVNPFTDVPIFNAAEFESKRQQSLLLDRKGVVLLDVAQTYYQVLQSEHQVEALKYAITVNTQRVKDLETQEKAGVASYVEVAQARAQLASSQNALIRAQNDAAHGRSMLALLMGLPGLKSPLSDSFKAPEAKFEASRLLAVAAGHRPDLQAAHDLVKIAARLLESAWAEYFPSVSLNLTYFLSRQSFPNDVNWTSLIEIYVPLFSAGLTHADVRTAYSRLRQANLADSYVQKQTFADISVILTDLDDDENRIDQTRIQVTAARDFLHKAKVAFSAGAGTYLEQLAARSDLLNKELALTEAIFKHDVDYLRLKRALGVLDTDPDIPIPVLSAGAKTVAGNPKTPTP